MKTNMRKPKRPAEAKTSRTSQRKGDSRAAYGSELRPEIQYSIFYKFMAGKSTKRLSQKYSRPLLEIEQIIREQMQAKPKWTYSQYRASLNKNGVIWAIVTPDGSNALPAHKAYELLCALNAPNADISRRTVENQNL